MARDDGVQPRDAASRVQQILAGMGLRVGRAVANRIVREVGTTWDYYQAQPDSQATADIQNGPNLPTGTASYLPGSPEAVRLFLEQLGQENAWGLDNWMRNYVLSSWEQWQSSVRFATPGEYASDLNAAALNDSLLTDEEGNPTEWVYGENHQRIPNPGKEWNAAEIERIVERSNGDIRRAAEIAAAEYGWNPTYLEKVAITAEAGGHAEVQMSWQGTPGEAYGWQAPSAPAVSPTAVPAEAAAPRTTPADLEANQVWVVGPDGRPMRATLSSAYAAPTTAAGATGWTQEQLQARVEELMDKEGLSEEDATTQALQESAEATALSYAQEEDALLGVPSGYRAVRTMQQYAPPRMPGSWAASGAVQPAGTGAGQVSVALEPQYHAGDIGLYYNMSPDDMATLQEGLVKAGLLEEGSQTGNPLDSHNAWVSLLETANWRGEDYMTTLGWLIDTKGEQQPTFTPSSYQAPDYDTLAETVYEIFSRDLGRDPEEWEVAQLASRFGDYYYQQYQAQVELERQQFLADNDLLTPEAVGPTPPAGGTPPIEGLRQRMAASGAEMAQRGWVEQPAPAVPAQEDPYSSFMQYFRQQYRPEMDMRRQVANNSYARSNLFDSIARMDTMMGGG